MSFWRDQKKTARRVVHETMRHAALYLAYIPLDESSPEPIPVDVRLHTSFKALGDQAGTSFQFAEKHEPVPQIIFLRDQIAPVRGAVVSVALGEAYQIDNVMPPSEEYVTAEVTRLSAGKAAGLPYPGAPEGEPS